MLAETSQSQMWSISLIFLARVWPSPSAEWGTCPPTVSYPHRSNHLDVNSPCGLAAPHYHPRASEFLYMLSGTTLQVGFILENGARFVQNTLNPNQGFLYPKNSFHYQANLGCDPVTFVAGFNHEDPGVSSVAQRRKSEAISPHFSYIA